MKSIVFGFALSVASASQFPVNLWLTLPQSCDCHLCPKPSPSYFSSQAACNFFSVRNADYSYVHSEAMVLPLMTVPHPRTLRQMHTIPYHIWKGNHIRIAPLGPPPPDTSSSIAQIHHLQSLVSSPFSRTVNCLLPGSVLSLFVSSIFLCHAGFILYSSW